MPQENQGAQRQNDEDAVGTALRYLTMIAVAVGVVVVYHIVVGPGIAESAAQTGPASGIVVVDTQAILGGHMDTVQQRIAAGEEFTQAQLEYGGSQFASEYMRAIKRYRDAGYLVIDKAGQAVGVPRNSEITEEIGKAMGIEVQASPDIFAAPDLQ